MSKNITRATLISLGIVTMLVVPAILPVANTVVTQPTQKSMDLVEMSQQGGQATILLLALDKDDPTNACRIVVDLEGTKVAITDSADYCNSHAIGDIIKF